MRIGSVNAPGRRPRPGSIETEEQEKSIADFARRYRPQLDRRAGEETGPLHC
jgi:hypothetical protein